MLLPVTLLLLLALFAGYSQGIGEPLRFPVRVRDWFFILAFCGALGCAAVILARELFLI